MCGIIGYVGKQPAAPILLSGLRRLEYRGYDSAGIALLSGKGLRTHKAAGKLQQLESRLPKRLSGRTGIGHTRWATHGEPSDINAHPHTDAANRIAVVHNGIIENAAELREKLETGGYELQSETDTEILAHLIAARADQGLEKALRATLELVHGTYGVAVIDATQPDKIVIARNGSPVIIGIGDREMFVASDVAALVRHTRQVVHLDDGEMAVIEAGGYNTTTMDATPTAKQPLTVSWQHEAYERGEHEHYMHKEITEQPEAVGRTLRGRLDDRFETAHLGGLNLHPHDLLDTRRIKILGCGSAYYAGMAGAHLIESLTRVPADAEPAAEFRYRNPVIERNVLYIVVSQSGETFDTLAALQEIKRKGGRTLGIVNVVGSTIAREVDGGIYMHAGPEVSVASTKAYTCMVVALTLFALHLGRIRDLSPQQGARLVSALKQLPHQIAETLEHDSHIKNVARKYAGSASAFFIGRASAYPTALEGAQKLKEISYIHAEAYPASELKHGPLALIAPEIPTVVVLPDDDLLDKSISSLEEIKARRGPVIALTNATDPRIVRLSDDLLRTPPAHPALNPALMTIPLQLFAYHAAMELGRDIDRPRNLAKSVTVE